MKAPQADLPRSLPRFFDFARRASKFFSVGLFQPPSKSPCGSPLS